jgi:OmpA-OmpF porin, OOP family
MKTIKLLALASAVASLTGGLSAHAQDYNTSWYIAPSAEIFDPSGGTGITKNGSGAALRFGKPLSSVIDLQFGGLYGRSRQDSYDYRQETLGADVLFMFSRQAFRPYVVAGLGITRDRIPFTNFGFRGATRTESSPSLNAGLGFQLDLSDRIALQLDGRRLVSFISASKNGSYRINNNYFGLGINFAFGGPAKSAPVVKAEAPAPAPKVVAPPPAPAPVPAPAPAPRAEPTPAPPPPPAPRMERITLADTELFAFDRAELKMPQPKLDEIANTLNANPQIGNIVVSGHTDLLGTDQYNQRLSQRRADAVKAYLVKQGVPSSRISAVGKGETQPVVQCSQKARPALIKCLEPNRRVEVEQISFERRVQ